jgi:hypothetical protein
MTSSTYLAIDSYAVLDAALRTMDTHHAVRVILSEGATIEGRTWESPDLTVTKATCPECGDESIRFTIDGEQIAEIRRGTFKRAKFLDQHEPPQLWIALSPTRMLSILAPLLS